jgi:phosphonate transport system substrate-binding protein
MIGSVCENRTSKRGWRNAACSWLLAAIAAVPAAQASDQPLTLGIFPRNKATETVTMYTPLAQHLSEQLKRPVVLATSRDFDSFWIGVNERRYDIVHYNQYHYIHSTDAYRVIGHNEEFGKSAVAGALYVRKDSGIKEISQLRGRTIVFGGGKDAMLSHIAPRFLLMQAGLKQGDFKSEFAVNPPNALLALHFRQADAAGGGDILHDLAAVKKVMNTDEVTILAATEPLLFLPWAVKRTMPQKLAEEIQAILVDLGNSEAGRQVLKSARTTGIRKAGDADYDPHRRMTYAVFGPEGIAR